MENIPKTEDRTNLAASNNPRTDLSKINGIEIPAPTEEEVARAYQAIVMRPQHSTFESFGSESQPISSDSRGTTRLFSMEAIRPQ